MKINHIILIGVILLYSGCTKNNQNSNPQYAYLNVNQTYASPVGSSNTFQQAYDIDNDGQVDWGFVWGGSGLSVFSGNSPYTTFVGLGGGVDQAQELPVGFNLNNTVNFTGMGDVIILPYYPFLPVPPEYYFGFKSQNPTFTNTYFGWVRLIMSSDFRTLTIKDMALNTVNGGSINVGQH